MATSMALKLLNVFIMLRIIAYTFLLGFASLSWAATPPKNVASLCPNLLKSTDYFMADSPGSPTVEINGAVARSYPLNFILKNLDIKPTLSFESSGNILLIGEGFSPLLPHILQSNDSTIAVDLWYAEEQFAGNNPMGQNMREYIGKHRAHLVPGSALQLPVVDQSQNLVLMNMLLHNLNSFEEQVTAINEVTRVLAKGGRAILAYHGLGVSNSALKQALEAEWGDIISVHVEVLASELDFQQDPRLAPDRFDDEPVSMTIHRLTIVKRNL